MTSVTSAKNPLLREIRKAVQRGARTADGCAVAEGFHLLDEALRSRCEVATVLIANSASATVERHLSARERMRVITLDDALFATLSSTEASQGVIALVRPPAWTAQRS